MARKLIVEIIGDSTSYQRSLAKSEQANRRFATSTKAMGASMLRLGRDVAIVGGVIGVLASREFNQFEDAMHKIVGLVGVSRKQVDEWGDQLLDLGTEVAKSPKELADALFFVTSAGFRGAEAMNVLSISAHASAAGLGDTKVVADAVTSAVNSYGLATLSAAKSADILTATVREGKTAADALAPTIGNIAPLAAELGVSFDQVGAAMAGMTRVGTPAMKAATGLRAVFSTLLKPQKRSIEAFQAQGLNIDKLRETLAKRNGLLIVLNQVKEAFGGNTKAMAAAFPNVKALTTVLSLVGKNADAVRGIFKRMADSTGSVNRAFAAISEDEGFQFERTLQALRAAGIRLGAILEPLANAIARGLTAAFKKVSAFLDDFKKARTFRAKLNVIWSGAEGIAKAAERTLKRAMGAIDWHAVFASARGMADALQARLEQVDWGFLGKRIGEGIRKAVDFIIPAGKDLADRMTKALRTINWELVGRSMGPGLVTAVLSAFSALLDPAFWVRNWDLALSVAFNSLSLLFPEVFGVGKILSLVARPFARLAAPLGRLLSGAITRAGSGLVDAAGRISERLAVALGAGLIKLPGRLIAIASRALAPFARFFERFWERIGGLGQFTIKVLGGVAAIRIIVNFGKQVVDVFKGLPSTISDIWNRLFSWIERRALKAALRIVEPFTHLPGFLGGGTFRELKEQWQRTLTNMEVQTSISTGNIQGYIDGIVGKDVTVTITTVHKRGFEPGEGRLGGAGGTTATPQPRRRLQTADTTVQETADAAGDQSDKDTKASKTAKTKAEKAQTAFEKLIDALQLKLDIATARRGFRDDLAVLNAIRQAILNRIKVVGKTTDLARQLFENSQQLAEVTRQANQAAVFKELGLTAEGEKPVASTAALLHRARGMLAALKGTALDTNKNRTMLKRIIATLKKHFKDAGREIRQAILDMLNDIAGATDSTAATGPLTKTHGLNTKKIIEGLGLSDEEARAIRQRLSRFNTAGRTPAGSGTRSTAGRFVDDSPIVVHTTINLDGKKVANNTTRHQQKGRRRNPPQRRGMNRFEHGHGF